MPIFRNFYNFIMYWALSEFPKKLFLKFYRKFYIIIWIINSTMTLHLSSKFLFLRTWLKQFNFEFPIFEVLKICLMLFIEPINAAGSISFSDSDHSSCHLFSASKQYRGCQTSTESRECQRWRKAHWYSFKRLQ